MSACICCPPKKTATRNNLPQPHTSCKPQARVGRFLNQSERSAGPSGNSLKNLISAQETNLQSLYHWASGQSLGFDSGLLQYLSNLQAPK